jgi:hypothetical protein
VLIFAGIVGEVAFGHEPDLLESVEVSLARAGIAALAFAIWGLRKLTLRKRVRTLGFWLSLVGVDSLCSSR